ncbi:MAG: AAA family ATPase [Candidatus Methylumidiphilus sp.]
MLTRIKLQGFKSFADMEVSFGPFTCIAGANGVGKSNLFDAIQFLRDLTEFSIIDAAQRVRDPAGRTGDIRAIFMQGKSPLPDVKIEADFIVPDQVYDDFNRLALPTATFLRYELEFRYVESGAKASERIDLVHESLTYIPKSEVKKKLGFYSSNSFRDSVIKNKRRGTPFISTEKKGVNSTIQLHQDGGSKGPQFRVPAAGSPNGSRKTLVGGINTNDYPTVLAARREMEKWTLLQLEPSALRQPDGFLDDPHVASNGAHMAATLLRLGVETEVSNRLSDLLDDVGSVSVVRDESRRTYTLQVNGRNGIIHPARSLSDGTLRFLALAILSADPESGRLLCLEEPENGIHPSRIPAILQLLREMAVDTKRSVTTQTIIPPMDDKLMSCSDSSTFTQGQLELPINEATDIENPLRQIIINTHSPLVVSQLDINDLLMAQINRHRGISQTMFQCVSTSWREKQNSTDAIPLGILLAYVSEAPRIDSEPDLVQLQDNTPKTTVREYAQKQQTDLFDTGHCE